MGGDGGGIASTRTASLAVASKSTTAPARMTECLAGRSEESAGVQPADGMARRGMLAAVSVHCCPANTDASPSAVWAGVPPGCVTWLSTSRTTMSIQASTRSGGRLR